MKASWNRRWSCRRIAHARVQCTGAERAPSLAVRHRNRPRIVRAAPMRASVAALAAFALVASLDEPTPLDRAVYARARRLHNKRFELAQRPLEIFGLPGVHIPVAVLAARALRRRGHRG